MLPGQIDTVLVGMALSFLITTGGTVIGVLWRRLLFQEERAYKLQPEFISSLNQVAEALNNQAHALNNQANSLSKLESSVISLKEEIIRNGLK